MGARDKQGSGEEKPAEPCGQSVYEKQMYDILCMMMAETSAAFEKLPCLWEADILRNILYMGVWSRYQKIQEKPV